MKKYCKALVNLGMAFIILLLIVFLVPKLLVFFAPFVAGWIIALIASPLVRFFEEKVKIKRKAGSAFVIVAVIALVILILYLVGAKLTDEIMGLIGALPDIWDSAENDFADIGQNLSVIYNRFPADVQQSIMDVINQIGSYVGDLLGKIGTPTINAVGNFAKQVPSILIGLIMALLSSYFFVAERDQLATWFRKHTPAEVLSWYYMLKRGLVKAVGGYLKAQLKIEVWMYLLLVIGLAVLQVDYALLIALGIAFLDFLPFFGTGTVMVPWAILKILSSDYKMAIGLLIIWGSGQLARQLIQPKIVGDSVGMPPLPTLFLLYIGYKLGGVVGMIVAVPVGLIALTMYQQGALQTTKDSVKILAAGINHFRRLKPEDMDEVRQMQERERGTGQTGSGGRGSKRSPKRSSKRSFCEKTERKEIMRNIRLRLQYEGTRYQGWQKQTSTDNTIQGKMEVLLTKMCGEPVEIAASGRTDAGVHALGQVANFHLPASCAGMSAEEIMAYCNRYLPEDIAVVEVSEAAPRFHSRLNATGKRYRYRIINSQIPDVFWRRYAAEEPEALDLDAMRKAAERLLGEHDFKAFTSAKKSKKSTVRRIDEIRIERIANRVEFVFTGNGFLHHMIRILVGTLLEVGKGIRTPENVTDVLKSGDRAKAGALVPAKGLVLEEVFYT
jgi:sporulation integral membrane protein YtvI/tRNA pseudouridine(38-40) synthase